MKKLGQILFKLCGDCTKIISLVILQRGQAVVSSDELVLRQSHGYVLREDISVSSHLKVEGISGMRSVHSEINVTIKKTQQ